MKQRRSPLESFLQYCGVLFLLCVLGLAVLTVSRSVAPDDSHCASSAAAGC